MALRPDGMRAKPTGRSSGVLLHPTCLPLGHGIGDLGDAARRFVDLLAVGEQQWWQVLPLNPPDHLGSPYSATSALALNPLLIDLTDVVARGWLKPNDLPAATSHRVDFAAVEASKTAALRRAFDAAPAQMEALDAFIAEHAWLHDWALFSALRTVHGGDWRSWPADVVRRDEATLRRLRAEHAAEVRFAQFCQWLVFEQWAALRTYAADRGVRIIGDVPIFVAMDSADVWAHRDNFRVDASGNASVVAGVPPDYFSPTGQKWGNPLYDWDALAASGYEFWRARLAATFALCDLVRIDHFRGFESYWEVPEDAPTAETGRWRAGPGLPFFDWVRATFGDVPFIAEDLGIITDDVHALRDATGLPGMKVMQFAFDGDPKHPFLPHNYPRNCVAYTGTHDNDTARGWYDTTSDDVRHNARTYLSQNDDGIVWAMIEALLDSDADLAIIPFQDLHDLGNEARINHPGTTGRDNWSWRMTEAQLNDTRPFERLAEVTTRAGRRSEIDRGTSFR